MKLLLLGIALIFTGPVLAVFLPLANIVIIPESSFLPITLTVICLGGVCTVVAGIRSWRKT